MRRHESEFISQYFADFFKINLQSLFLLSPRFVVTKYKFFGFFYTHLLLDTISYTLVTKKLYKNGFQQNFRIKILFDLLGQWDKNLSTELLVENVTKLDCNVSSLKASVTIVIILKDSIT